MISSAGRRVELIECFRRAGKVLGSPLRVIACDCSPGTSAACFKADASFAVPRCDDPAFIPEVLRLCRENDVALVVPTIDPELQSFANSPEKFASIGSCVAVSSADIVRTANDKGLTFNLLKSIGLPTPRTFTWSDIETIDSIRFPVIAKPIVGSSSIGMQVFTDLAQLRNVASRPDYLLQEYWAGSEYTVNLFFDKERLRCSVPHLRLETRGGEVSKARTEKVDVLLQCADTLGAALAGHAFGALCFQAIVTAEGQIAILELNARFGGGYPLADYAGARFAQWLLEIAQGQECSAFNSWKENVQMLRYDCSVFTDLSSTGGKEPF